jgi:hypothetical protein
VKNAARRACSGAVPARGNKGRQVRSQRMVGAWPGKAARRQRLRPGRMIETPLSLRHIVSLLILIDICIRHIAVSAIDSATASPIIIAAVLSPIIDDSDILLRLRYATTSSLIADYTPSLTLPPHYIVIA